jgi:hypothetical protein
MIKDTELNLHCCNNQKIGKIYPNRKFKNVEIVGEVANEVDNDGGKAVSEKRPQQTPPKHQSYHNVFST